MQSCFSWWQVVVRLSDWGSAMEHDEPGQVGNQAALSRSFLVPDSIPAGDFLFMSDFIGDSVDPSESVS